MTRILSILLLIVLAGCAGSIEKTGAGRGTEPAPRPGGGFANLPLPSQLKHASVIPGERSLLAAQYEMTLPNARVSVQGNSLQFAAAPDLTSLVDVAFAMYEFDLTGYTGVGMLGLTWQGGPPPATGVWVGLTNFTRNRWDWQPAPQQPEIDLGLYGDYVSPVDSRMVLTVLSTNALSSTLQEVHFGAPGLEPPINIVASDSAFTDKVQITWDPPASGPAPTGYKIFRADDETGPYAEIGTSTLPTYDDASVTVDVIYWYRVKSTKSGDPDSALSTGDDGVASAGGLGWTVTDLGPDGLDPVYLTLAEIDGNPAFVQAKNSGSYTMQYYRALDSDGTTWGTPFDLGAGWAEPCLGFFADRPAVCYVGPLGGQNLEYRRGSDTAGSTWEAVKLLHDPPGGVVDGDPDMCAIGGNPAIAFRVLDFVGAGDYSLQYIRASDALGDTWAPGPTLVDGGEHIYNPKLAELGSGAPAILYCEQDKADSDNVKIKYVRASDDVGWTWETPVTIWTLGDPDTIAGLRLVLANGRPAAFIHDGTANTNSLYFVRADDADGTSWPASPQLIAADVDYYDAGTIIADRPATLYLDNPTGPLYTHLYYLRASDSSGSSWSAPELVLSDDSGLKLPTLAPLEGKIRPGFVVRNGVGQLCGKK